MAVSGVDCQVLLVRGYLVIGVQTSRGMIVDFEKCY